MTEVKGDGLFEAQFRAWGAELDRLKAKVDQQMAEAKKDYYEHLEELREDIESQLKKWTREIERVEPRAEAQRVVHELRTRVEAELSRWAPEIEELRRRASTAEAEAEDLIDALKARRKQLKAKLGELRHASGEAWGDVKTGAAKAWEELKPALQNAIGKFK